jgi:preprotein translocase subunit SecG
VDPLIIVVVAVVAIAVLFGLLVAIQRRRRRGSLKVASGNGPAGQTGSAANGSEGGDA